MNDSDYGFLKMRKLEAMTALADRRNAGADMVFENTRYSYLMSKDRVSFAESTAQRFVNETGGAEARDVGMEPLPISGGQER